MSFSKKPIILIPLDSEASGGYSKMPWYALRQNYAEAVFSAGGMPVFIPHHFEDLDQYLSLAQGILVPGGSFDIDPSLYGETSTHEKVTTKPGRTQFEWALTQKAYEQRKAILGICGGMQLLNVVLGGTLIQHIPDTIQTNIPHEQPNPRTEPGHAVSLVSGSFLHSLLKKQEILVNSAHHQAIATPARILSVNAVAPDGIIEGIESQERSFCLGVQWHPEYHVTENDKIIFNAFIMAASDATV
jgi:putative glutamine amidotransferase